MPIANYCKKCKAEVPEGASCPYCGGKLAQTGERVSFGVTRLPVKDWFAWNSLLRVALPVLGLTTLTATLAEAVANGAQGVISLAGQGFFATMLALLAATLALVLIDLLLQGRENVHYVLDKDGVRALGYLSSPTRVQLYARFLSPLSVEKLQNGEDAIPDMTLVRRAFVPWSQVRRVRLWRENQTILYFRPTFWLALSVRCPAQELALAESFTRKKLKRFKKVRVLPKPKKEANV